MQLVANGHRIGFIQTGRFVNVNTFADLNECHRREKAFTPEVQVC